MKVFIFGTGKYYRKYHKWIQQYDVIALLDNNPDMQGHELDGYKVISPKGINEYYFDRVYILSIYLNEIIAQLVEMGVPREKLFCYFQMKPLEIEADNRFYYPQEYRRPSEVRKKRIVFISHELSVSGAPRCLLQAGQILVQAGYEVVAASPYDGALREAFLAIGVTVIVDQQLTVGTVKDINWLEKGDILFINTVKLYYLLLERPSDTAAIWWLHEPEIFYDMVVSDLVSKIKQENLKIYTVSEVADKALHRVWKNAETVNFVYGIPDKADFQSERKKVISSKRRFITIGHVSKIKGHDILVEAISLLDEKDREQAEFLFVGGFDTKFGKKIIDKIEELQLPVSIEGEKTNQEVLSLLEEADVVICASRAESLSMAVTEGMMKEKPVIVSSEAGNVSYIQDGENGLLFQSEKAEKLKNKIVYCIKNPEALEKMASAGRKTYLENFSLEKFELQLKKIIKEAEKL